MEDVIKFTWEWNIWTVGFEYRKECWWVIHLGPFKIYKILVYVNYKVE